MAHSQDSLHIEIQNLKDELEASRKEVDQYAHMIAKFSCELDSLLSNICHACKTKLVPGTAPLWRRQHQPLSRSPVTPSNMTEILSPIPEIDTQTPHITSSPVPPPPAAETNLSTSETADNLGVSPANNSGAQEQSAIEPESELSKWAVVYNPAVKQALDLHVAHVFPYAPGVCCAKMSPEGQRVAIGLYHDGKTYINDVRTGSTIRILQDRYVKDSLAIWSVQFSPDGQLLATAASDNRIRIWHIAKGRLRTMLKGHKKMINEIAFSPDGRFIVSVSDDCTVRIWNIRDGSSTKLAEDSCYYVSVVFSPDGRYIAAGNTDFWLRIWNVRTHKLVAEWKGHANIVWCLAFTPDGKGLMSGSHDETVQYWDVSSLGIHQSWSGEEEVILGQSFPKIMSFSGHTEPVRCIAFFPGNSEWVLTGAQHESAQLWDSRTGVCQMSLLGHTDWVLSVDFSRTEKCLVTASRDHVTVWKYEVL